MVPALQLIACVPSYGASVLSGPPFAMGRRTLFLLRSSYWNGNDCRAVVFELEHGSESPGGPINTLWGLDPRFLTQLFWEGLHTRKLIPGWWCCCWFGDPFQETSLYTTSVRCYSKILITLLAINVPSPLSFTCLI